MAKHEHWFIYKNAKNEISKRHIIIHQQNDAYISGRQVLDNGYRTFRKAQIQADLENQEAYDAHPAPEPAVSTETSYISRKASEPRKLEIAFTGFPATQRAELEKLAQDNNLQVRKQVTVNLDFLCTGKTAGPKKVESALAQGVILMDEVSFNWLIATGEIPV